MAKRSIHTEAVLGVMAHLDRLRSSAKAFSMPGLMMEDVDPRTEAARVANMSAAERRAWVEHVGVEHAAQVAGRLARAQGKAGKQNEAQEVNYGD